MLEKVDFSPGGKQQTVRDIPKLHIFIIILEHCITFDLLDSVAEELLLSLISFILLPDIKESNADFTSFLRF